MVPLVSKSWRAAICQSSDLCRSVVADLRSGHRLSLARALRFCRDRAAVLENLGLLLSDCKTQFAIDLLTQFRVHGRPPLKRLCVDFGENSPPGVPSSLLAALDTNLQALCFQGLKVTFAFIIPFLPAPNPI